MLALRCDDDYLDIGEISISLVLKSPILNDEDGSYSYNFSLPASNKNRKIFGFPHRIEGKNITQIEVPCTILFNGIQFLSGILLVTEANENQYECNFGAGKGEFNYQIRDKLMNEVYMGEDIHLPSLDPSNLNFNDIITKFYPEINFALFPIKNEEYIDSTYYPVTAAGKMYNYMNYYFANPNIPDNSGFRFDITPFPYLAYFLDNIFKTFGYNNTNNPIAAHAELKKIVIFNVHSKALVIPQTINPVVGLKEHLPDITISSFLKGLSSLFCLNYFFNNSTRRVTLKFFKDILKDKDVIDFSKNILSLPKIKYDSMNLSSSMKLMMNMDSSDQYASDNCKSIHKYNYRGSVNITTELPPSNNTGDDIFYVILESSYYIWKYDDITQTMIWEYFCNELLPDYYIGNGENEITKETEVSTLLMKKEMDDNVLGQGKAWLIPVTKQNGYFQNFAGSFENICAGRLLFYRGIFKDSNDMDYPLGSSDVYDFSWIKISDANLALRWDGQYGLYENFWKDYIYWFLNIAKFVKFTKQLSPIELRNIDFSKKYRVNDQNYLLKEIRVTLTNKEIKVAEIDAYTCP